VADCVVSLKASEVNHAITQHMDVNNWAAFEHAVVAHLQHHAQTAAAHVAAVSIEANVVGGHAVFKFKVTSGTQLQPPAIKAALR
jgi:hypothetical protein